MTTYTQEQVDHLVDGRLDWDTTIRMLSMPKDGERFEMYLKTLQKKLDWNDRIVLPLAPHLYIVQRARDKHWVTKCDCGHEFGDYRQNWKLAAHVYVREDAQAMSEVYPKLMRPTPNGRCTASTTAPSAAPCTTSRRPRPGIR